VNLRLHSCYCYMVQAGAMNTRCNDCSTIEQLVIGSACSPGERWCGRYTATTDVQVVP
jgi:hypothetical protein